MSIATEIARISGLRDKIRTKLNTLGIISNTSASLDACTTAINSINNVTPSTPATSINVTPTISAPTTAGVVTVSGSATASVKPTTAKGYTKGTGTAGTITAKTSGTKTITTQAAKTYTPGTSNQTIAAQRWLTGAQTIAGDSNLVAANIKSGVKIFGVTGNLASCKTKTVTVTPSQMVKVFDKTTYASQEEGDDEQYDWYYYYIPVDISGISPRYVCVVDSSGYYYLTTFAILNGTYVTLGYSLHGSATGYYGISGTTLTMQGTSILLPVGGTISQNSDPTTSLKGGSWIVYLVGI